jgi:hypothetical protein
MFVLFLIWAFLAATGCATVEDVVIPVTAADLSNETTTSTTVPVSAGDIQGDLTVITLAGATPWTLAVLLGLLLAFQVRRHNTTMGALDRVLSKIDMFHGYERDKKHEPDPTIDMSFKSLKRSIEAQGQIITTDRDGLPVTAVDRRERFLRSRLARQKK